MKLTISTCSAIASVALILASTSISAQEGVDALDGCPNVFSNPGSASPDFRQTCADAAREHRAELESWGVSTQGMSDLQVWDRHDAEFRKREQARQEQERRDALEAQRLENQRQATLLEQQKLNEQREREAEANAAQQMQRGQQMMQQQSQMLQGLGVNMGGMTIPDANSDDDDDNAFELQMYQKMIENGVAPQCKGKEGDELIDCVDTALDQDESEGK